MENIESERKIDFDYMVNKGIADYTDGDIMVIDKIDAVQWDGIVKLDMIMMIYCGKGRLQGEIDGKTYLLRAGDVAVCL